MNAPIFKTVLMVDDSAEDAALMQAAFKDAKAPGVLRNVTSADDALNYLQGRKPFANQRLNPFPDLLLLDIQMPGEDGFSVLQWVRSRSEEWRRVPIVMLTTSHDYREIKRAYDLGANSFLVKPTGFHELSEMVASLLAYWLAHNKASVSR